MFCISDILRGGQTENDNDSVESLTKSSRHEIKPGPEQAPDNPAASFSLVRKPQVGHMTLLLKAP